MLSRVLVVKLSSLGDVVHALPVVADLRALAPDVLIDWVVEPAFAPLLQRVRGIRATLDCPLRRWTQAPSRATAGELRAFLRRLRRERYDAVLDLQGLTKSAVIAALARGPSYGLANRTEGASHEAPARWLVTNAIRVEPHSHALDRSRALVAAALGTCIDGPPRFGLEGLHAQAHAGPDEPGGGRRELVFVHGTSRADKLWPEADWIALGRRAVAAGWRVGLPQAGAEELSRAERLAAAIGSATRVWPASDLGGLVDRLAATAGVVGVDSGPSHVAVALGLPHVQIYNHPTAWRTGPQPEHGHGWKDGQGLGRQRSVEGRPSPSVDAVWAAWQAVAAADDATRGER